MTEDGNSDPSAQGRVVQGDLLRALIIGEFGVIGDAVLDGAGGIGENLLLGLGIERRLLVRRSIDDGVD